ncbi:hypothetical protein V6N13_071862 [Hibiscus sabdariffa]
MRALRYRKMQCGNDIQKASMNKKQHLWRMKGQCEQRYHVGSIKQQLRVKNCHRCPICKASAQAVFVGI